MGTAEGVSAERISSDTVRGAAQQERVERRETGVLAEQKAWRVSMQEQKPAEDEAGRAGLARGGQGDGAATRLADFVSDLLAGSSAKPGAAGEKGRTWEPMSPIPPRGRSGSCARGGGAARERCGKGDSRAITKDMETGRRCEAGGHPAPQPREHREISDKGRRYVRQMVERRASAMKLLENQGRSRCDGKYRREGRERERD